MDDTPQGSASPATDPRPDSYEAKYMGGARSLARSRVGIPWWMHLLLGLPALWILGSAIATGKLALLALVPLLALVWLLLSFLRVTVTAEHVHVQYGLFGPKVPVAAIERAVVEKYNPVRYGGWGIRMGIDGSWAFSIPGRGGRGVRIEYRTPAGKTRAVFVTTDDPEAIVAAIEKARAAKGVGVRVETGDGARDEAEAPRGADAATKRSRA